METIHFSQLPSIFENKKGSKIVYIQTLTEVKMNKKLSDRKTPNPYHGKVFKLRKIRIQSNFNYQDSVNRKRISEGLEPNFISQGFSWGTLINPYILQHNSDDSKLYFYYQLYSTSFTEKPKYLVGDKEVDFSEIKNYLPPKKDSYKNQGVDNPTKPQIVKIENIQYLSIDGEKFKVVR